MRRDFTYIDDLVDAVVRLIDVPPERPEGGGAGRATACRRWRRSAIVNIGNSEPVELMDFIAAIEAATGRAIEKRMLPMQPGDVPATWADTSLLERLTGRRPETPVADGRRPLRRLVPRLDRGRGGEAGGCRTGRAGTRAGCGLSAPAPPRSAPPGDRS